jgi:hypothetical protein
VTRYTIHYSPMKGDARDTNDASPTPTNMRQMTRLQKPIAVPLPATATVQTANPMPMSLKPAHGHPMRKIARTCP